MARGAINETGVLQGQLSTERNLQGQINTVQTLQGTVVAPVVLKGAINSCSFLKGKINPKNILQGNIIVPIEHYEEYKGEYSVTPKVSSQTLHTQNLVMKNNLTILEIPYFETSNETGNTVYIGGNNGN